MTASVTVTNSVDELNAHMLAAVVAASVSNNFLRPTASITLKLQQSIYDSNNNNNNISSNSNNSSQSDSSSSNSTLTTVTTTTTTTTSSGLNVIDNSSSNDSNNTQMHSDMSQTIYMQMEAAAASVANTSMASLLQPQDNQSFVYEESEQEAINRSLLLLSTAASATMSHEIAPHNIGLDSHVEHVGEWSHFYDLMLSWQGVCLIAVFCTFIVTTIVGNTLVILAVITTRRLKTVTNCFVMSLAVADLLVGIFVMPPAVAVHLIGSWQLGWILCDIWISLDVLLCTASILSLCAISVDRYLAVTQPLTYSRKRRSKRLALIMIFIVWVLALAITCPPMFGWYEPGRRDLSECRYNQNEGYVIFSAMGSFFIPMAVMIYVYARISCVIASRHDNMTDISVHNKKFKRYTSADVENELDHELSEQDLSSGHKKQAAARTLSNQTIAKDLHDVTLFDDDDGGTAGHCSLMAISAANAKNGCYELTCPSALKRTSTTASTMTALTNEQQWSFGGITASQQLQQHQAQQLQRHHSVRSNNHIRISAGGNITGPGGILIASPNMDGTTPSSYTTRNTRVHHHHHHSKSLSNRISSLKKENKTTQTLSIVVGGFIACWLPFFVYYLITPFLAEHQVSRTLANVLTWLGWFNSAINPFIYAFYSVDFRAAFWRLTCKRFFSTPKPQFPSNTMSIRR